MKKKLSALLAALLVLLCTVPAFADGVEQPTVPTTGTTTEQETEETTFFNEELQPQSEEEVTKEAQKETAELLESLPVSDEYFVEEQELPEEETTLSEDEKYLLNVILFSTSKGAKLSQVKTKLKALGVREITPVFEDENGNALPMGNGEEIWYRAYTNKDAAEMVAALTEIDGVANAEPEYIYTADAIAEPDVTESSKGWIYGALLKNDTGFWWNTIFNHDFYPGTGTVVAVIDTGVDYTHEDLKANMWVNQAELDGKAGVDDDGNGVIDDIYGMNATVSSGASAGNPMDDHGHGTHVAGIVGMANNLEGSIGLAYGSKIMALKAGNADGTFAAANVAKAINYATQKGADVINMSFGSTSESAVIKAALETAYENNCILVASAGNNGKPTTDAQDAGYSGSEVENTYPAAYDFVLGVMALDQTGRLASFSNYDYTPTQNAEYEIAAPGVQIFSTIPGNRYATWSGTSMAAPCVSAAAAILRSHYDDKNTYSSQFIMGQLSSASRKTVDHVTLKDKKQLKYKALDIYDAVARDPQPNISIKDVVLLDSKELSPENDGDGVVDAGETIDLGVLVRNQWGKTGDVTVNAEEIVAEGTNSYISFAKNTVTLSPIDTFTEYTNGIVYDESGNASSVSDPLKFTVNSDVPNNTKVQIKLTVTTTNGVNTEDKETYTATYDLCVTVQKGKNVHGTISEDTTWSKDYLWIVEDAVLIESGATLTIEPGTKVQFYSKEYETATGKTSFPHIDCKGTLNAIGTAENPIEMYLGEGFEDYAVQIYGDGTETLQYCNIANPLLGGEASRSSLYAAAPIALVDHCNLTQQATKYVYYRYVEDGIISTGSNRSTVNVFISTLSFSSLSHINLASLGRFLCDKIIGCRFEDCCFNLAGTIISLSKGDDIVVKDSTFVNSAIRWEEQNSYPEYDIKFKALRTNESRSYYQVIASFPAGIYPNYENLFEYYQTVANDLGGSLASLRSFSELDSLTSSSTYQYAAVGMRYDAETGEYRWLDSTNSYTPSIKNSDTQSPYVKIRFGSGSGLEAVDAFKEMALEFPIETAGTKSDLPAALDNYTLSAELKTKLHAEKSNFTNNAIINTNSAKTTLLAAEYVKSCSGYATYNYWGTEDKNVIDGYITDGNDHPGTYVPMVIDPILTTASPELETIYPFVKEIYLTENQEGGEGDRTTELAPGRTYTVHVVYNRAMDKNSTPQVSYGAAAPYHDVSITDGHWSETMENEWLGTVQVSSVLDGDTMYWRTTGGAAASDNWLVCGTESGRFSFSVNRIGVLSMVLSAEGGEDKITLSWIQNDYDTLAGYNLYRSTSQTSGFQKLNTSVLSVADASQGYTYIDTGVKPGTTYYYYFKVVNTTGTEEKKSSNTASATPLDNIKPVLKHTTVTTGKAGSAITISATATDNIAVTAVKLHYKKPGDASYTTVSMTSGITPNLYAATIPAVAVTGAGVQYYVTAEDGVNTVYSGTAAQPNVITVDTKPYIIGITPTSDVVTGGKTVTILGGNFTSDLVLKIGETVVANKTLVNDGEITFIAPAMPSGAYPVTLTTSDGLTTVVASSKFAYSDNGSVAEIPQTMEMLCEKQYQIPLYVTTSGELYSLHAELDISSTAFSGVSVVKANNSANITIERTYSSDKLVIGCISSSDMRPASDKPLLYINVTPNATPTMQETISLHDVQFNGTDVKTMVSGTAYFTTSYTVSGTVNYYTGSKRIDGVTISAGGKTAVTDSNGTASFTVTQDKVTVFAQKNAEADTTAVTAFDASLVLQSAIGSTKLTDYQKIAADVSGDGSVNEYDAALILQKAVRKISRFPAGDPWQFVPKSVEKTLFALYPNQNNVNFTAILLGDVDGSYATQTE